MLLEHVVHHELTAYIHYEGVEGSLGYWATPSGSEVDFVWWHGSRHVAIEVNHGTTHRPQHRKGIASFLAGRSARSYIVYQGDRELDVEGTKVLPVETFLRRLHDGDVIG